MKALLLLAVLPGVLIAAWIYKKDKIESEPGRLLAKLFLLGCLSIIPAILLELLANYILSGSFNGIENPTVFQIFIEYFLGVGLVEEACKYFVLKKCSWKNDEFNFRFDAIVYSIFTCMGFAVLENIFYVAGSGFGTAISRALISIPGHASFAICMGIYYGQAKLCELKGDAKGVKSNLRKAIFMPMLMHGFFDFCLSVDSVIMMILFFVYIIIVDIVIIKKSKYYSKNDVPVVPVAEPLDPLAERIKVDISDEDLS